MSLRFWTVLALVLAAYPPSWLPGQPAEPSLTDGDRNHWSFRKPVRPSVPSSPRLAEWTRNPVDSFILARLEQAGLQPSAPADRAQLLRRVTFDLTGLPPTPAQLEAFLADERSDAFNAVVDRLLASPEYGERWAQHWLDVVRYADSNGYEIDGERPHAWRYRDYVARSLNQDKPYDQFVREQIAGDLLAADQPPERRAELLVATGFHRCGPVHLVSGNTDPEVNRQEVLTEMTATVGSGVLGLTVGCARCHDHKFDPISQADYYRLQAFFAATQPKDIDIASEAERAQREGLVKELGTQLNPLKKQVADIEAPYRERLTKAKKAALEPAYREALDTDASKRTPQQVKLAADAQTLIKVTWDEVVAALSSADREKRAALRSRIHELEAQMPPPAAQAWSVAEDKTIPPTALLKRGDPKQKGAVVQPGFLRVLKPEGSELTTRLDRRALADWLTRPEHPLTPRVLVNRLWEYHFGRGIVATPNDWGLRGEAPMHPELLDWLACEFVENGWSIKHMHRLMVLSSTYRQTSRLPGDAAAQRVDPDNKLLSRMSRRRLQAESLRDGVQAVAGTLNPKQGGPVVRVPLEPEVYDLIFTEGEPDGLWPITPDVREHARRSIYLFAKRNVRLPLLEAFDQPDTLTSCPVRPVSTFAPQALILLNGPFMQEQSKALAARLCRECGGNQAAQIDRAFRLALCRPPMQRELDMTVEFLKTQRESLLDRLRDRQRIGVPPGLPRDADPATAAALADFCLALLNRNEFLYVP